MTHDQMFQLVQSLAAAKSRQNVPEAMKLFDPEILLVSNFGSQAKGLAENEATLTRFFKTFPDYNVMLDGHASDGTTLTCWGSVQMTMTGDRFGVTPNGRRAELPVFIQFTFKNGKIASERFAFDLSELCAQSGVSTDAVRQKLFGDAAVSRTAAA